MNSAHLDGTEPIADDELLYRRIPVSQHWYDPIADPKPLPQAFRPRTDDVTGLSVDRGKPYNTPEEAAQGPSKAGYYVACLRVGDLRAHGIDVVPRPVAGIKGHAEIINLTAANRDSNEGRRLMELLAERLCLRVEGPFHTHQS
jgi:hypothetical protein